ncbi:hypothetical protein O3P69_015358 [Scylla paramamosain]|uniref:Uncharacterized protein n=1 Tax=Scylla paramamosain TaxID=85552 RepID=A0AAW0T3X9_SCYPA
MLVQVTELAEHCQRVVELAGLMSCGWQDPCGSFLLDLEINGLTTHTSCVCVPSASDFVDLVLQVTTSFLSSRTP